MDRNSLTGLLLIFALTFVWMFFFRPKPVPQDQRQISPQTQISDSAQTPDQNPSQETEEIGQASTAETDSSKQAILQDTFSDFYIAAEGTEDTVKVVTDKLTVLFSTKGARPIAVYLNDYKTYDSLDLPVLNHPEDAFYIQFPYRNRSILSKDLYFKTARNTVEVKGQNESELVFSIDLDDQRSLEYVYTFNGDRYDFHYDVRFKGIGEEMGNQRFFELYWNATLPKTELSLTNMRQKSTIAYSVDGEVEKVSASDDPQSERIQTPVKWTSYKSQFFSAILIADKPFRSAKYEMTTPDEKDSEINRVMDAKFISDTERGKDISVGYTWYMGPNEYVTLSDYDLNLEGEMDLGWSIVSYINIGTTYIFKWLEKYISNYGLIIIILALLIRTLVFPLTYKSFVSMAKMRVLNNTPEMKALDEKFKDDPQKLQMEKMGIYRQMGVSMFGGCLPMLFSYPFLIALFFFFPQSVELRQQSFLWANDLSTYDSIVSWTAEIPLLSSVYGNHMSLFCLLMAISTFVYTFYQQKSQPTTGAGNQFKYIAYFMPIFLLIFLNNYASGLSLYYLTSNLISIAQTTLIRFRVNDEKLLTQMRETQKAMKGKKGKKKNKSRIEKWMEGQQKKQQEVMKERKKQQGSSRRDRRIK